MDSFIQTLDPSAVIGRDLSPAVHMVDPLVELSGRLAVQSSLRCTLCVVTCSLIELIYNLDIETRQTTIYLIIGDSSLVPCSPTLIRLFSFLLGRDPGFPPVTSHVHHIQNDSAYVPCRPTTSRQLLLDEERPQVRKLPCAGTAENNELNEHPPDNTCVCSFGLIAEFGLSFL